MNHLLRDLAPFGADGWAMLDAEARARLVPALSARKIVDFDGPHGWQRSAVETGRTEHLPSATGSGIAVRRRTVLPLVEVRADFSLQMEEIADFSRGADDVDLTGLDDAVLRVAAVENRAVLQGWAGATGAGVTSASTNAARAHDGRPESFRAAITSAVATLRDAGVDGPYTLASGPDDWAAIIETDDSGYSLRRQIEGIIGGTVERSPGIEESVLVSTRGGDFTLTVGEDLTLGYSHHDADHVFLYVEETFAVKVDTPEASVPFTRTL
jgi:uncharacterized linocin/CFP29 family protein